GSVCAYFTYWGSAAQLNDSGMRILWQLIKGEAAALTLLAGCVLAFKKRAGIVLLHGGILLMMFSEVLVSLWAVESQMNLAEGQATNYVQDIRSVELAVIDTSAADHDQVSAIPENLLLAGHTLSDHELPLRINVTRFYKNADFRKIKPGEPNLATAGMGLQVALEDLPASAGTDSDARVDTAGAYVKLTSKDGQRDLGTYLLSVVQSRPERVEVDGKTYELELRFRRHYKPYSFQLIDVTKDDYLGTETPRSYASKLLLIDPSRGIDQEVNTWMNNPLRFADETFYQSNYHRDPRTGQEMTTLSVVSNRGWMIPYVACMIVATGMLVHFMGTLLRFLRRVKAANVGLDSRWAWIVPAVVSIGCLGWLANKAVVHHPAGEMDLYEFGKLPLVYEGRVKPFDTLAINSLQIITGGRQEFRDEEGQKQPAIRWLLDVVAGRDGKYEVFRIDHPEVLDVLRLPRRESHRYSIDELQARAAEFEQQTKLLEGLKTKQLNEFQRKLRQLQNQTHTYMAIVVAFREFSIPDLDELQKNPEQAERLVNLLISTANALGPLAQMPRAVPREDAEGGWMPYVSATAQLHIDQARGESANKATLALQKIFADYEDRQSDRFNRDVAAYQSELDAHPPRDYAPQQTLDLMLFNATLPGKPRLEAFFN
ncbi:MAG TPA: hypothetical protein VHY20_01185, partial [Pirellulales bacterium]|nr:hypothetical protein [Pirellulales bacterium]